MRTSKKNYLDLANHYQRCLDEHGDSPLGMDWPRAGDNQIRHRIMMELFSSRLGGSRTKPRVLDFGCGTSHFYEFLRKRGVSSKIRYIGVDILPESITLAKRKFPGNEYRCVDIMAPGSKLPAFDFAVINGLFTQKRSLSQAEMMRFLQTVLRRLFAEARSGIAFNTLSDQVDFKRPGSFHLNLDWAANFFVKELSRNFVVRHDYGLYENTFYVYKKSSGR